MIDKMLSLFHYPFPTLKNPFASELQAIKDHQWIEGEYHWLYENDPAIRLKYNKNMTAHIASQWPRFPVSCLDRILQINIMLV